MITSAIIWFYCGSPTEDYISIFEYHWQQQLQPKINVLHSGCPDNPSWPTIFLLMFVTHSCVNPPHRRLLSGVSCPSPLKFPFQITQVTVFNNSLHVRSYEDHFPTVFWTPQGLWEWGPSVWSEQEWGKRSMIHLQTTPWFFTSPQLWVLTSWSKLTSRFVLRFVWWTLHAPSMQRARLWVLVSCRIYRQGLILLCLSFDAS